MRNELQAFFEAYLVSWPKGAAAISDFYAEPCLTARGGNLKAHLSRGELTSLFDVVDRQYRERGYEQGEQLSFDWQPLGVHCALTTIRWAYKRPSGETIWETTFSYNVIRRDGTWKIYAQTMHD
jgi:hypothetical protein